MPILNTLAATSGGCVLSIIKRIAALCRDWGVTLEELEGEQVMHARGG